MTSRAAFNSMYDMPPNTNTMERPPVKLTGPVDRLCSEPLDLAQRFDAPVDLRALEASPRRPERTEREFAPRADAELAALLVVGPISGMGKTLG